MVKVGVGEDHCIKLGERVDLRHIEVGSAPGIVRLFPAVDQDPAVRRGQEECGTADFPAAAEHGNPDPLVFFRGVLAHLLFPRNIPVDPPADGPQELLPFLVDGPEILTDLLNRGTLNRGCPDNLGCPPDMAGDIPECRPVLADDNPGLFCFDQYFTGICIKKDVGDSSCLRDNGLDLVVRFLGIFQYCRPYYNPLAQVAGKDFNQISFIRKPFRIVSIYDQLGSFELDLRHRNAMGHFLVNLIFELFEPFFNQHKKVVP